jgi:hypothetical protein
VKHHGNNKARLQFWKTTDYSGGLLVGDGQVRLILGVSRAETVNTLSSPDKWSSFMWYCLLSATAVYFLCNFRPRPTKVSDEDRDALGLMRLTSLKVSRNSLTRGHNRCREIV